MNFIAASLLYHSGEVGAFWLLIALMDQYRLKENFKRNLPGLIEHDSNFQKLIKTYLPFLSSHLVAPPFDFLGSL